MNHLLAAQAAVSAVVANHGGSIDPDSTEEAASWSLPGEHVLYLYESGELEYEVGVVMTRHAPLLSCETSAAKAPAAVAQMLASEAVMPDPPEGTEHIMHAEGYPIVRDAGRRLLGYTADRGWVPVVLAGAPAEDPHALVLDPFGVTQSAH